MFLPIRTTWLLMIFKISFDTCFGIDVWWFLHRSWINLGILFTPFAMPFSDQFLNEYSDALLIGFVRFRNKMKPQNVGIGSSRIRPITQFSCKLVSLTPVRLTSAISKVFQSSRFPSRFSCTLVSLALVKPTRVLSPEKKRKISWRGFGFWKLQG